MQPLHLGGGIHHEEITVTQLVDQRAVGMEGRILWFEAKAPGGTQAEGSDRCCRVEFRLVIGVPVELVATVAVAIEQ